MPARRLVAAVGLVAFVAPLSVDWAYAQDRPAPDQPVRLYCKIADNEPDCRAGVGARDIDGFSLVPLFAPNPTYPRSLAGEGIEGWVLVRFSVTEEGAVRDAAVIASEPVETAFDEAALRAVDRYEFQPALIDGQPVAVHNVAVRINFSADQ